MIEPENNTIKVKPEEVELFPHSDSNLWDAFKNKSDIANGNNEIISSNKNINSDTTEKNNLNLNNTDNKSKSLELNDKNNPKNKNEIKADEAKSKVDDEIMDDKNNLKNENEVKLEEEKSKVKIEQKDNKNNPKKEYEKKQDKKKLKTKFYYIQLASVANEELVPIEWKRLLRIYPEISKKIYEYKKINLKNGEIYFRILLGKFKTKKESEEYCLSTLKKSKCIIRSYE